MTKVGEKKRKHSTAAAVLICALLVSWTVAVGSAAAEAIDSAPIVNLSEGGSDWFPAINGPEAPDEYPVRWDELSPQQVMRQVDDQEVVVEDKESGYSAWTIAAVPAHDAEGVTVPTTVKLTEGNVVTLTVHYRAGNPAAGGAPFAFPISTGAGWAGGHRTTSFETNEPKPPAPTQEPAPTPCTVPTLHGLSLKAAKARLRTAHCAIGAVRLAAGATAGKGRVVKQFRASGTRLGAGAAVAVKLGARREGSSRAARRSAHRQEN